MKKLKALSHLLKVAGLKIEADHILKISSESDRKYLYHETSREALGDIKREGLLPTSYGQSLVGDDGRVISPEEKIDLIRSELEEEGISEDEIEETTSEIFRREVPDEDLIGRTYVHLTEPSSYSYGEILLRFPIREMRRDVDHYILDRVAPEELEWKAGDQWLPLILEEGVRPEWQREKSELYGNCGSWALAVLKEGIERGVEGLEIGLAHDSPDIDNVEEANLYHVMIWWDGSWWDWRGRISEDQISELVPLGLTSKGDRAVRGEDYSIATYLIESMADFNLIKPFIMFNTDHTMEPESYAAEAERFWDNLGK